MLSLCDLGAVVGAAAFLVTLPLPVAGAQAPDSTALRPRYSGQGWAGFSQASAPFSASGSGQALLAVPDGSTVDWAGLYWGSALDARAGCAAAPADTVRLSLDTGRPVEVSVDGMTDADGLAYQAYADVTSALGGAPRGLRTLTVSGVPTAEGCDGGWTVLVAYSYPDGPHETTAPTYRTVAIYDGLVAVKTKDVQLGLPPMPEGPAQLTAAVLGEGVLQTGGEPVPLTAAEAGYHTGTGPLADGPVTLSATRYAGLVLAIATDRQVGVDLGLSVSASSAEVDVGDTATLSLTLRNRGEIPASAVVILAKLPATLALQAVVEHYDAGTGIWTLGTVPAQGSSTLTLTVQVVGAGAHRFTAWVATAATGDHDPVDDRASVVVTGITAPIATAATATQPPPAPAAAGVPAGVSWASVPAEVYFGVTVVALGLMLLLSVHAGGRARRT